MFPPVPPITNGQPDYVVAFLAWKDLPHDPPIDLTAGIKLHYDKPANEYAAHEDGTHWRLGGKMSNPLPDGSATLKVQLWHESIMQEEHEFTDVDIGPKLPWDSHLQHEHFISGQDLQEIHVRA